MAKSLEKSYLFRVRSVLGVEIRTSEKYWEMISRAKHPELKGNLSKVIKTIKNASSVYRDQSHKEIYLYYRKVNKHWVCAVCRHLNSDGFLVTAYLTSRFKRRSTKIWQKEK